jgi:ADP-ribosylglycohydrolase
MRIAPLGLFFRDYGHAVRAFATMDAAITHNNLEAREGSKAVAIAVMYLARGVNPKDALLQAFATVDHTTLLRERLLDALLMAVNMEPSREQLLDDLTRVGTHCDVTQTVPAAFLAFLGTRCFRDAVEVAIRAGGDTDTTAAITGALAGTYYGTQEVDPYLADLEDGQQLRALEGLLLERPSRPYD